MIAPSLLGICSCRQLISTVFGDFAHAPSTPSLQADPDIVRSPDPFSLNVRCARLNSASRDTKLTEEASLFYLMRSKCTLPRCDDYNASTVHTGPVIHDLTRHKARRHPLVAAVPRRRSGTVAERTAALRRARQCAQPSRGRSRAMAARVASRSLVRIDGGAVCRRGERKHPRGANRTFPQICLLCDWQALVFSSRRRGKDSVR